MLTCSWQLQSSVLIDMLHQLGADIRIVELDTGLLFPETYETRERLVDSYDLDLERIDPRETVEEQALSEGPELWRRDPDRCCALRKVEPLSARWWAWTRGSPASAAPRASPGAARKVLELDPRGVVKVQPLAGWTDEDVKGYLFAHDVPYNPLHDRGFPSIGCTPCTRAIRPGEDSRAGRWADAEKTECGLHLPRPPAGPTDIDRGTAPREGGTSVSDRSGYTIWFTGLSGTGKSTIAEIVGPELEKRGALVEYLDGDVVRTHLSKGLGFSKEDRDTNIGRIGWVASRFTRAGVVTLVSAISPYADTRAAARALVEEFGPFVEVFVNTSVDECAKRDVKGLYAKAFSGEIKEFTGVSDPYEAPENPDVHIPTESETPAGERRRASSPPSRPRASSATPVAA